MLLIPLFIYFSMYLLVPALNSLQTRHFHLGKVLAFFLESFTKQKFQGRNSSKDPNQAVPWARRREVSGSGVARCSGMRPQSQEVESELQEAPFSIPIHTLGVENGVEIQIFVLELKNMTKGKRGKRRENKSGAQKLSLILRVCSSYHCGLLQTPYPVNFRRLNRGTIYAGKKENVLHCTSSFKDKLLLREKSTWLDNIKILHCKKPAGP